MKRIAAMALAAWLATAAAQAAPLQLAWRDAAGEVQAVTLDAQGRQQGSFDATRPVALGSLWKLVAYAQWIEAGVAEQPLRCTGRQRDEVYCCAAGESIDRGTALARSCGLYFSRDRVPWSQPAGPAMKALPAALARAVHDGTLGPATQASPRDWLNWLAAWPTALRERAQQDLLVYWVAGAGRSELARVAGRLRIKTYTVERSDGTRLAGASGWNEQDLPLWFGAPGTSADVVPQHALKVLALTHAGDTPADEPLGGRACVRVHFFARYPIVEIVPLATASLPAAGPLYGRLRLRFASGTTLQIESHGELRLSGETQRPVVTGELALEDYVARVIDREAQPEPAQAAWALAVAARTHLLAHGKSAQGCIEIDDSTAAQRVSPRPASAGARAAAQATAGLVLAGGYAVAGLYHQDQGRDGVLSWAQARKQAAGGAAYLEILQAAYPRAGIASAAHEGTLACEQLPLVRAWLERERPRWARMLSGQAGYTDPGPLQVCRLAGGRSHAVAGARRIDVPGYHTLDERIAVAHEFVHVAFARHPRGRDEQFVENQARQLLGVMP